MAIGDPSNDANMQMNLPNTGYGVTGVAPALTSIQHTVCVRLCVLLRAAFSTSAH